MICTTGDLAYIEREYAFRKTGMYQQLLGAFLYLAIPPLPHVDIDIISKLTMTSWFKTCGT